MKIFVICGPNLDPAKAYDHAFNVIGIDSSKTRLFAIPEGRYGAQECRKGVVDGARNLLDDQVLLVITRHGHPLYGAVNAVHDGVVKHDEVEVHLEREDGTFTVHHLDQEVILTNNWPLGILWGE